jgi:hypothetical protein
MGKVDRGLKYQTNCRIAGNELNMGEVSFQLTDADPNRNTVVVNAGKWTRK